MKIPKHDKWNAGLPSLGKSDHLVILFDLIVLYIQNLK